MLFRVLDYPWVCIAFLNEIGEFCPGRLNNANFRIRLQGKNWRDNSEPKAVTHGGSRSRYVELQISVRYSLHQALGWTKWNFYLNFLSLSNCDLMLSFLWHFITGVFTIRNIYLFISLVWETYEYKDYTRYILNLTIEVKVLPKFIY